MAEGNQGCELDDWYGRVGDDCGSCGECVSRERNCVSCCVRRRTIAGRRLGHCVECDDDPPGAEG